MMINYPVQSEYSPPSAVEQKTFSVLLIDDEPDILTIFKKSLEMSGYSTYGFVNPVAAVEHFKQNPKAYDIVITDVRMPGMTGFEVARIIKKLNPDVKIILTSSFEINMKEFKAVLPSIEIDGFLDKPMSIHKLGDLIKSVKKNG